MEGRVLGGRYRVVRQLGEGGMGAVFEAVQENLGRRVAVKVLATELCEEPAYLERFRREAEAAGRLMSPHIVQVNDFIQTPGDPVFLVMELLEGQSLLDLLRRERLTVARACRIGVQLLSALGAAHAAGIVHRDLKPANIFLVPLAGGGELVKLLDFGIAMLTRSESYHRLTGPGVMIGTPRYAAPEQIMSQAQVDARTDLYAVGVLLYGMLAGRPPFTSSGTQLLLDIQEREPPDLRSLAPSLPAPLVAAVQRAMRKRPEERFQSAAEMVLAIQPFAQEASVGTDPTSPVGPVPSTSAERQRGPEPVAQPLRGSATATAIDPTARSRPSRPSGAPGASVPSAPSEPPVGAPPEPSALPVTSVRPLPEAPPAASTAPPAEEVAAASPPVPRTSASPPVRGSRAVWGLVVGGLAALGLLGAIVVVLAVGLLVSVGRRESGETPVAPARPATDVTGGSLGSWDVDREGLRTARVVWASGLRAASSEYDAASSAARQILGPPDVYPAHGDDARAWASEDPDGGPEHVHVVFPPVRARAVVIVESFHPGAVARVDDLSSPAAPVVLWEGRAAPHGAARVLTVQLVEPRTITELRVVLDTTRVPGWNELDAIGLLPAQ
jgi:serine/threonine-protein kinase